jgi:hypothetical protein
MVASQSFVPREHLGQARLLFNRVREEGRKFRDAVDPIWPSLKHRYQRSGKVRSELLAGAARQWRTVPSFGRLSDSLIEQHHYNLQIAEFRLLLVNWCSITG